MSAGEATPPDCPPLAELDGLVAGVLGPERAGALEAHASSCSTCDEQLAEIRANRELVVPLRAVARRHRPTVADGPLDIAGYELGEELHRGGQGIVYRATQLATRRDVAIKVLLLGSGASSRQQQRFEREVELAAGLAHPNVVTVLDGGTLDDGRHYFAMELIDGLPFDVYLERHELALRERMRLFLKLCEAVRYAHQRGVIHRDLKPSNVLVDERSEPHVLDFGLAKPTEPGDVTAHTLEGEFVGTLAFASPEQVQGDPDRIDVRTDVYSLGVLLYRMLAGRHPYAVDGTLLEAARNIAEAEALPPSRHAAGIDGDLDVLCLQALAKQPARRYQSVDALAADVEAWLSQRPIAARGDSGLYVLRKLVRRHRVPVAALVVVIVALATAVVVTRGSLAEAQLQARRSETVNDFLIDTITAVRPGREPVDTRVVELMRQAARDVERTFADDPVRAATLRQTLGSVFHALGLYEESDEQYLAAIPVLQRELGPDHRLTIEGLLQRMNLAVDRGHLALAEDLLGQVESAVSRSGDDSADTAYTLEMARVTVSIRTGRHDDARRHIARATELMPLAGEDADPAGLLNLRALLAEERSDHAAAEELLTELLAMRREALGDDHPSTLATMNRYAWAIGNQGKLEEAGARVEQALAALREDVGEESPLYFFGLLGRAHTLWQLGRLDEAETEARAALALALRLWGRDGERTVTAMNNLAQVLQSRGDLVQAEALLQGVLEWQRESWGNDARGTARTALSLGMVVGQLRRFEEAEVLLREAAATMDLVMGRHDRSSLYAHNVLGVLLVDTSQWAEGEAVYRELLDRCAGHPIGDEVDVGAWLAQHAWALAQLGRYDEAEQELIDARERLVRDHGAEAGPTRVAEQRLADLREYVAGLETATDG